MTEKINLKKLEKSSAGSVYKSGVVDIGIGLIFLVVGFAMLFDDYRYYIDALLIVPVIFISLMVKHVVTPRMGVVNFNRSRKQQNAILFASVTTFLIIMVASTFFGTGESGEPFINPRIIISAIIFSICIAIAFSLSFDRMYFYAFLLIGMFNWSEEIRENSFIFTNGGYAYLVASSILIAIGSYLFIKFLKDYPKPEKDITYGN